MNVTRMCDLPPKWDGLVVVLDHCLDMVKPHLDEQSVIAGGIAWSHGVRVRQVTG